MSFLRTIFSRLINLFPPSQQPIPPLSHQQGPPPMSLPGPQTTPSAPPLPFEGVNCPTCGSFVLYKVCQSNTNGNRGRLVAVCVGSNCRFFRWHPSTSRSPSPHTMPPAAPPLQALPISTPQVAGAPVLTFSTISSTKRVCPAQACGQTHLADDCDRKLCRKHCLKLGGCSLKKHKPPSMQDSFSSQPVATPLTSAPPSLEHFVPFAPTSAPLPPASTPEPSIYANNATSNLIDFRPNPTHASHIRPIYTQQLTQEYELYEARRREDAERQLNAKKAKQSIIVHAWSVEDTPAAVCVLQEGFTWPYLSLSPTVLLRVGLSEAGERGSLQLFDNNVGLWVNVNIGHTFELEPGAHVYLKDAFLPYDSCPGLEDHYSKGTPAHFRTNLPQERAYVRAAFKAIAPSSPSGWYSTSSTPSKQPVASTLQLSTPSTPFSVMSPSPSPCPTSSKPNIPAFPPAPVTALSSSVPSASVSVGSFDNPIELSDADNGVKRWPGDFHVCKVVACLQDCTTYVRRRGEPNTRVKDAFHRHFPRCTYHSSTFSDQRTIWREAPVPLKERFLAHGYSDAGLWSKFAAEARRASKKKAEVEVLELTD